MALLLFWALFLIPNFVVATPPDDTAPGIVLSNPISSNTSAFQQNLQTVINFIISEAPTSSAACSCGSPPDEVYGLGECYNQSRGECLKCLYDAKRNIDDQAPLTTGARMYINNSCYLHYENFSFFSSMRRKYEVHRLQISPEPAPAVPSPLLRKKGTHGRLGLILGCSLGAVVIFSVACAGFFFLLQTKKRSQPTNKRDDLKGRIEGPSVYNYGDLRIATDNFSPNNKLGQGGFGTIYKGVLNDGTKVAVKKLSVDSPREKDFVNEVNIISRIQHRNLVKLKGYCADGEQSLLVLELFEKGSLDDALFSGRISLDWPTRQEIVIGISQGLAYLHEQSQTQIIHRDIKASNILLDDMLKPKITDFGVSKLFDRNKGYASTRVAGTLGYLAPEYALFGLLTTKADVFSFGILVLEIISGKKCNKLPSADDEEPLAQQAWKCFRNGESKKIIDRQLLDSMIESEALRAIHIALLCTQEEPEDRPIMSQVVAMLVGYLEVPRVRTQSGGYFGRMISSGTATSYQTLMTSD